MSDHVHDSPSRNEDISAFSYPYASAPDIIRSHQKDTYFQSQLSTHLTSVLRTLRGARFTHTYATDLRALGDLLYLCLTTLLGNRTLGEEYCDIVQLSETSGGRLPEPWRRGAYIVGSVLVPYGLQKALPAFRRKLRAKLEISLRRSSKHHHHHHHNDSQKPNHKPHPPKWTTRLQTYLLSNLDTLTSPSPIYALGLSAFYFTGAYYHLSKRLLSLRYIMTRHLAPHEARSGYEVLGVLLVLQLAVQTYLHATDTLSSSSSPQPPHDADDPDAMVERVSLNSGAYASNTALLPTHSGVSSQRARISRLTSTPFPPTETDSPTQNEPATAAAAAGTNLEHPEILGWIDSPQQRKCTLCLEAMREPSVTVCGHVFCWTCIQDWIAEKPECPLCRQGVLAAKILPLRG